MSINLDLTASQAVRVSYGAPNGNYEGALLRVGVQTDTSTRYMTLVQFDMSAIPSNSIIDAATLRLWSIDDACWNTSTTQLAQRLTSSWDKGEVTYNSIKTSMTASNQASMTNGGYQEWYEWDVKNIVQDWSDGALNYGFWLIQDGLTTQRGKCFELTGYVPQLEIDYTPVGMQAKVSGTWEQCLAYGHSGGSFQLCKTWVKESGIWRLAK